ncbi:hypothetical protein N665_0162s0026, partial [Sinapis alba]
ENLEQSEYGCDKPWLETIWAYFVDGTLHADKWGARKIKTQDVQYITVDGEIYKWKFSEPFMMCVEGEKARKVMEEVHSGSCRNHSGGRSLAIKIERHSHYWPTMIGYCEKFAQKNVKSAKDMRQQSATREDSFVHLISIPFCWGQNRSWQN